MASYVEVLPRGAEWAVHVQGEAGDRSLHGRKIEAERAGRALARQLRTEFVIKNRRGQIIDRDSYGNDPFPPRDRVH